MAFRKIIKGIRGLKSYILGHMYALQRYDKQYLKGRWFEGKLNGMFSTGWMWVCTDARECRRLKVNQNVPWPVSAQIRVVRPENITFHPDDLNNFQGVGNYFQAIGPIQIGRGSYIASNVGIITANHNPGDLDGHLPAKAVTIGKACWIGMNSVILPGVTLGDHTIVGAGSVVTKSFPEGYCVVAGNPAKPIRSLRLDDEGEESLEHKN